MDDLQILIPKWAGDQITRDGLARVQLGHRGNAVEVLTLAFQAPATMVAVIVHRDDIREFLAGVVQRARDCLADEETLRATLTSRSHEQILQVVNSDGGVRDLVAELETALSALAEWGP